MCEGSRAQWCYGGAPLSVPAWLGVWQVSESTHLPRDAHGNGAAADEDSADEILEDVQEEATAGIAPQVIMYNCNRMCTRPVLSTEFSRYRL